MTYYLVQGDDAPSIQVTLTRDVTGTVIDLSNKTAVMKFRKKGTSAVLATLTNGSTAEQKSSGVAVFSWDSTDLDIDAGLYEAEIELTDTVSDKVETVYELLEFRVREDF